MPLIISFTDLKGLELAQTRVNALGHGAISVCVRVYRVGFQGFVAQLRGKHIGNQGHFFFGGQVGVKRRVIGLARQQRQQR